MSPSVPCAPASLSFLYAWVLPIGVMVVLWVLLSRGLRTAGQSVMSFGKSRARLVADRDTGVTFDDVAGCDEAKYELQEVVDFLKNPDRYIALGAKIPKGVLLVGLPGTGKTLLSRAVAGEARVPFFSLSGSEFVEMFVGVGPRGSATCSSRPSSRPPASSSSMSWTPSGGSGGCTWARSTTRRADAQPTAGRDGRFPANVGVILLAATNRPEVLDKALLRPGRFDRQVVIDAPGHERPRGDPEGPLPRQTAGRRRRPAEDRPGDARLFRGRSGQRRQRGRPLGRAAQVQRNHPEDMEEAVEKVVAGPERKSRRLDEQGKRRVAYHEVGHALVAAYSSMPTPCTRSASCLAAAPPWAIPCSCPRTTSSCSPAPNSSTA